MRKNKFRLLYLFILPLVVLNACDDSGITNTARRSGEIKLDLLKLQPLNPTVEGFYEIWLHYTDTLNMQYFKSFGKFNVSSNGSLLNEVGDPKVFSFGADTNDLSFIDYCVLTVEPPGTNNPEPNAQLGSAFLLAGDITQYRDSCSAPLTVSHNRSLGATGRVLTTAPVPGAYYILNTPTDPNNCLKGIWIYTDADTSGFPPGLGLPASSGWVYQGWVVDKNTNTFYSMGRFNNPYGPDFDGAGPCAGTGTPYPTPGQDWVQTGGNCPQIQNLNTNSQYGVFVTVEPAYEQPGSDAFNTPFFFKLFNQGTIHFTLGCRRNDNLFNQYPVTGYPFGRIRITKILKSSSD